MSDWKGIDYTDQSYSKDGIGTQKMSKKSYTYSKMFVANTLLIRPHFFRGGWHWGYPNLEDHPS